MVDRHFVSYFTANIRHWMTSWWFQPIWKILVKLDHSPRVRGENKKYLKFHHLDDFFRWSILALEAQPVFVDNLIYGVHLVYLPNIRPTSQGRYLDVFGIPTNMSKVKHLPGCFPGSLYETNPNNAVFVREIPENDHRFVLLDSPQMGFIWWPLMYLDSRDLSSKKEPSFF